MKDLVVIGAGKFALEVTRYIDDITESGAEKYRILTYLSVDGEPVQVPAGQCVAMKEFVPQPDTRVVLALPDLAARRAVIDGFITEHGLVAENIVHPSARVQESTLDGVGNIIGPDNYLGVNVIVGSYNVVNYHCTIGHHSSVGSNNFIAPNLNSGNSIEIGDDNFFGVSCTIAPEVVIGSNCRFQAGINLFDNASSGFSYLSPSRVKSVQSI